MTNVAGLHVEGWDAGGDDALLAKLEMSLRFSIFVSCLRGLGNWREPCPQSFSSGLSPRAPTDVLSPLKPRGPKPEHRMLLL